MLVLVLRGLTRPGCGPPPHVVVGTRAALAAAAQIPIAIIADLDKESRDTNAKKPAWFSVYKTVGACVCCCLLVLPPLDADCAGVVWCGRIRAYWSSKALGTTSRGKLSTLSRPRYVMAACVA